MEGEKDFKEKIERKTSAEERFSRVIAEKEVDVTGHVSYLGFQRAFATAHQSYMERRGMSLDALEERFKIKLMVRKLNVEYERDMVAHDLVTFTTTCTPGDTSIKFNQAIINIRKEVVGRAEFILVAVKDGKSVSLPEEAKAALLSDPESERS
jgi:acyl-CoA thioesterase FadM